MRKLASEQIQEWLNGRHVPQIHDEQEELAEWVADCCTAYRYGKREERREVQ